MLNFFTKIISLCNGYFIGIIIVQYLILMVYDYNAFKKNNEQSKAKQCKIVSNIVLIICIILFIFKSIYFKL